MIKNILIFLLALYGLVMTLKYLEADFMVEKLKRKISEFNEGIKTDTVKIYEVKATRDTIIKYVYKTEVKTDTIFKFRTFIPEGTYWGVFNWDWRGFLSLRDTLFLTIDSTSEVTGALKRSVEVKRPVKVSVRFFEKEPFDFWWNAQVVPSDVSDFIELGLIREVKATHFFTGAGAVYIDKFYPSLNIAILHNKHLVGVDISLKSISVNYRMALK
jgi:hypothetical protein